MSQGMVADLRRSLKRLKQSNTPRKRRNAIRAFKKVLRDLEKATLATYRPIRDDGSTVPQAKSRGGFCPYCKVPFIRMRTLAKHLNAVHRWIGCPCGKGARIPFNGLPVFNMRNLTRHIAAFPDLGAHIAKSELLKVAREMRNGNDLDQP